METLRFLMVTTFYPPYHLGGDAVHVQYLARALAARGHEVHVEFSPAAYGFKRRRTARRPSNADDGVMLHAIPGEGWGQPVAAHLLGKCASITRFHERLLDEAHPDIVHLHNTSLLGLGVFERRNGSRALYTAHDYWIRCPRSDLLKYGKDPCEVPTCVRCALVSGRPPQMWRYSARWRGLPRFDCAIAPSRFMARAIASAVDCPVVHIPNFAPDAASDSPPAPPAWPPGEYFLFVGVLENHKGISELVAASIRRPFPVRIVGRGSLYGRLKAVARDPSLGVRVEGWVSREELLGLYRGARALVIPSRWPENAPLAAVEALSCGTPLLVARRGGLEELLHDGVTGLSFEPEPAAIADAVDRFERSPDRDGYRTASRRAYERYHRPDAYLRRYLDVARGVLPDPDPGPDALDGPGQAS